VHFVDLYYTGCPTCYRTRRFFNNSNTNEDIATKQTHTTDTFLFISHTTNVLLFKFRCNIFTGVRIIKEMPDSVESGTSCITGDQVTVSGKQTFPIHNRSTNIRTIIFTQVLLSLLTISFPINISVLYGSSPSIQRC
jgi:hypothetical protein